jgi:hypothetical protein
MTTREQNKKAIQEGQQVGPAQKTRTRNWASAENRLPNAVVAWGRTISRYLRSSAEPQIPGRPALRAAEENRTRRRTKSDELTCTDTYSNFAPCPGFGRSFFIGLQADWVGKGQLLGQLLGLLMTIPAGCTWCRNHLDGAVSAGRLSLNVGIDSAWRTNYSL